MGYAPRALLAGGLGLAASFLVACGGSSGLLSGNQANDLNAQLNQVSQAVSAGQCGAAANAASQFSTAVENLPGSVNQGLLSNLQQGAQTINALAQKDCRTQSSTSSTTSSTTTSSSSTTTTSTIPTSSTSSTTTSISPTSSATSSTSAGTSTTSGSGGAGLGGTTTVGGAGGTGPGGGNGQ